MENTPSIHKKINLVMSEVEAIGKDRSNKEQGFKYRGIDDMYNALHRLFVKHGMYVTSEIISAHREQRVTQRGGTMMYSIIDFRFHFTSTDDGSSTAMEVRGEGMDSGDKASNKAFSIALKYALMALFLIPTEDQEDPDASTPEPSMPVMSVEEAKYKYDSCKTAEEQKAFKKSLGDYQWSDEEAAELKAYFKSKGAQA